MNILLSAHSPASQFTGAVFLFQCSPNAHASSCPFHCLRIMWTGCTSPVFIFLSFASDGGFVHLLFTKWIIIVFGILYSGVIVWGHCSNRTQEQSLPCGLCNLNENTCIQAGRANSGIGGLLIISEPVDSTVSTEVSDVVQLAWEDHWKLLFFWLLLSGTCFNAVFLYYNWKWVIFTLSE